MHLAHPLSNQANHIWTHILVTNLECFLTRIIRPFNQIYSGLVNSQGADLGEGTH